MSRETPSIGPGAILRTLADASDPLQFSELRRAVGIEDTGRFNNHLTELRGRFVSKTVLSVANRTVENSFTFTSLADKRYFW